MNKQTIHEYLESVLHELELIRFDELTDGLIELGRFSEESMAQCIFTITSRNYACGLDAKTCAKVINYSLAVVISEKMFDINSTVN